LCVVTLSTTVDSVLVITWWCRDAKGLNAPPDRDSYILIDGSEQDGKKGRQRIFMSRERAAKFTTMILIIEMNM
jgi:hypothetical protein